MAGQGAIVSLAELQREDTTDKEKYSEEVTVLLGTIENMLFALPENRASIESFKTSIRSLPRITLQFNQSKRALLEALDECSKLFDETERSIFEITAKT